jgi:hypothetical protein
MIVILLLEEIGGAIIGQCIAAKHHKNCKAFMTTMFLSYPDFWKPWTYLTLLNLLPVFNRFPVFLSKQEMKFIDDLRKFESRETAYQKIQGTKPQSLGYGLNDSPLGLLAWITEKYYTWTDCRGRIDNAISKDVLLTTFCIYWFSKCITSSMRLYKEVNSSKFLWYKIPVPTAVLIFPKELYKLPKSWIASKCDLQHHQVMDSGGHFSALEKPNVLQFEITRFFKRPDIRKLLN